MLLVINLLMLLYMYVYPHYSLAILEMVTQLIHNNLINCDFDTENLDFDLYTDLLNSFNAFKK